MKTLAFAAVAAALVVGCASAGTAKSGLKGKVTRGPITPVCRVGVPCTAPARGVKLVFSQSGKVVGRTTTNSKGWYQVALAPGVYSVNTDRKGFEHTPKPPRTTVPGNGFRRVDFYLDTGIR